MASEHLYDKDTGAACATYKDYAIGFGLSLITTCISFGIVGSKILSPIATCVAVIVLALIQFFCQAVYFLHLNTDSRARWNVVSFVFALIVVLILVAGTMWIMFDLYAMMM